MALKVFYFTLLCDSEFVEAGHIITAVGRHLEEHLSSIEYGTGVKEVAVGVVMRELGKPRPRRKPKYIRERRTSLLGHVSEDTLEFDVHPSLDSVRSAASVRDLIETLRMALTREADAVRALNIPDFDTPKFLKDVDVQLELVGQLPSAWVRLGAGRFALEARSIGDAPSVMAAVPEININEFPSAVLAFVERELPLVRLAAERKDRTALGPLSERLKKFIEPWAGVMTSEGGIFETFQDCAHLLPDLGREVAIECDRSLADTERERLHLEFQKRLEGCRACAERIQMDRNKAN